MVGADSVFLSVSLEICIKVTKKTLSDGRKSRPSVRTVTRGGCTAVWVHAGSQPCGAKEPAAPARGVPRAAATSGLAGLVAMHSGVLFAHVCVCVHTHAHTHAHAHARAHVQLSGVDLLCSQKLRLCLRCYRLATLKMFSILCSSKPPSLERARCGKAMTGRGLQPPFSKPGGDPVFY